MCDFESISFVTPFPLRSHFIVNYEFNNRNAVYLSRLNVILPSDNNRAKTLDSSEDKSLDTHTAIKYQGSKFTIDSKATHNAVLQEETHRLDVPVSLYLTTSWHVYLRTK